MRWRPRHQAMEEWGTTAVEYAIMIGFIAVVIALAVTGLGIATESWISQALPGFGM